MGSTGQYVVQHYLLLQSTQGGIFGNNQAEMYKFHYGSDWWATAARIHSTTSFGHLLAIRGFKSTSSEKTGTLKFRGGEWQQISVVVNALSVQYLVTKGSSDTLTLDSTAAATTKVEFLPVTGGLYYIKDFMVWDGITTPPTSHYCL